MAWRREQAELQQHVQQPLAEQHAEQQADVPAAEQVAPAQPEAEERHVPQAEADKDGKNLEAPFSKDNVSVGMIVLTVPGKDKLNTDGKRAKVTT